MSRAVAKRAAATATAALTRTARLKAADIALLRFGEAKTFADAEKLTAQQRAQLETLRVCNTIHCLSLSLSLSVALPGLDLIFRQKEQSLNWDQFATVDELVK
jgi:hypothetical protein